MQNLFDSANYNFFVLLPEASCIIAEEVLVCILNISIASTFIQ